jgi:hypothetical protein
MCRPGASLLSVVALAVACARPVARVAQPPVAHARGAAFELLPAWRDRPVAVALPGGAIGLLFGGVRVRWVPAADTVEAAREASPVALAEARSLAHGTLFRDERQRLWRADDFLAPLRALGEGPATIVSPPGSVGSVALRRADAVAITDGRDELPAAGLGPAEPFALSFCDASRGYGRAADGLLERTDDGGRSWVPTADEGVVCEPAPTTVPEVPPAVVARARVAAVRALPSLLDAMPSAALDDGRTLVATRDLVELWSADRSSAAPLLRAPGCEVAAWGPCAAVLCAGDEVALHRLCAGSELRRVAHGCRGAFVLSDDGRHALCASSSLEVRLLDAETGATSPSALPFRALASATLHGDVARATYDGALHTALPGAALAAEPVEVPLASVAQLGDAYLLGHVGDRLWWRPLTAGPWRRLDAVPAQPFGAEGSRLLARGDLSPAPPRFACTADACRFGAAIVRRPDALPAPADEASAPSEADAHPTAPAVVDPRAIDRCVMTAALTHRRSLPGVPFDGPVHAALGVQGATATIRWMTEAGVRAATLPEPSLPGPLSPGDDPEIAFPQGVPAAVAATARALYLVTADGVERASLWTVTADGAAPRAVALPGALPPLAGDALWEGAALADGGLVVAQSAIADEVAAVRVWTISPAGEVTGGFQTRSRELPFVAAVDGAPGVVTWTPRADGALDVAFRGVTTVARWRVPAPAALAPCAAATAARGWADVAVDAQTEREGAPPGTAARSVVRVSRARVRLGADGLCVDGLHGVTGAPAPGGRGLFAADLFLTARGGALVGHEHDGLRATAARCAAP